MLSAAASSPGVSLPPALETEVETGVFTNRKLPEPQWERPILCRADDEPLLRVSWLWPGRIPQGKATLFTGPPGVGKSFLALDLATRITRGAPFPDAAGTSREESFQRGEVLIVQSMHEAEDVVRPRLYDMGADLGQIRLLSGVTSAASDRLLGLPDDIHSISHALEKMDFPRLVIIDSLDDLCVDRRRAANFLRQIQLLALKYAVPMIVLARSNPRRDKEGEWLGPTDMVLGQAPVVWSLVPSPGEAGFGSFLPTRCNFRSKATGLAYLIEDPGRVSWGEIEEDDTPSFGVERAMEWMHDCLNNQDALSKEMDPLAVKLGFTRSMLKEARARLKVRRRRSGFGPKGFWLWTMKPLPMAPQETFAASDEIGTDPAAVDPEQEAADLAWLDRPVKCARPVYDIPRGPDPLEPEKGSPAVEEAAPGALPAESSPRRDDPLCAPPDSLQPMEKPRENEGFPSDGRCGKEADRNPNDDQKPGQKPSDPPG